MRWAKFFIIFGMLNLVAGGVALFVLPSKSFANLVVGAFCLYYGYRLLEKHKDSDEVQELRNKLNDDWVSDAEKKEIRDILKSRGIRTK